jgi:Uma2 family endonuclease
MVLKHAGDVDYPTTDGRPMAETDTHREQMFDLIKTLQRRYADHDNVYVSGNLLLFYVEGNKRKHISPDVMVVFGVKKAMRDHYLLWREGRAPQVVIEITSSSTRHEDMVKKKRLYLEMGVQEYFVFDPLRDYIKAQLRGWRSVDGQWVPMLRHSTYSQVLQLDFRVHENWLRLRDPASGRFLPNEVEIIQAAKSQAAEAEEQAAEAREQAAAAREQAAAAREQVAEAREQAAEAREQAAKAERRAQQAEAELQALRAEFRHRQVGSDS